MAISFFVLFVGTPQEREKETPCHRRLGRYPEFIIAHLHFTENSMLSGSMETIPSSYEDSAILLDQEEDFGFIRDEDEDVDAEEDDFEHVPDSDDEDGLLQYQSHRISDSGSVDNNHDDDDDDDLDALASTGILILEPAVEPPPVRNPYARSRIINVDPASSPQLTMPGSDSIPTDIQSRSFVLDSVRTPSINSSNSSIREEYEENRPATSPQEAKQAKFVAYGIMGSFLVTFCVLLFMVVALYVERRSWVQSNQQLESQMQRMQNDWVNLASKWQMDQEASLATSRSIKATLQAQVEEQRRKIDEMYQKQHEQWEKKEQEKERRLQQETERRQQQDKARRQQQDLHQRRESSTTRKQGKIQSPKPSASFQNKKSFKTDSDNAKTFEDYWSETENKLFEWSEEAHHRLRNILNGVGKKVSKAKDSLFEQADRTFQHVRVKLTKAWNDFYVAFHEPKDGWAKAAPVISTVLLATAAAALTEGTSRFMTYLKEEN